MSIIDTASNRRRAVAVAVGLGLLAPAAPVSAADTSKPSAPTALAATATNTKTVKLTWAASRDNVGVTAYIVYRNGTEVGRSTSTALTLTDQPASVDLFFQVLAVDAAGNRSVKTAPVTAYVDITKPPAPVAPFMYQAMDERGWQAGWIQSDIVAGPALFVGLVWHETYDDSAITGYAVYRDGVQIATVNKPADENGSLTFGMANVPPGKTFSYQLQSIDSAGNRSVKSPPTNFCLCHVTQPGAPKNPVVTRTGNGVRFTWDQIVWPEGQTQDAYIRYYGVFINGVRQQQPSCIFDECEPWLSMDNDWQTFAPWNVDLGFGPFPPLPTGKPLSFQVFAVDYWGNFSVKTAPITLTL